MRCPSVAARWRRSSVRGGRQDPPDEHTSPATLSTRIWHPRFPSQMASYNVGRAMSAWRNICQAHFLPSHRQFDMHFEPSFLELDGIL